jgi:hypothetical membrane protein
MYFNIKWRWIKYSGIMASIIFWAFTLISISINRWFDFYRDAFSDLGGPRANNAWIYNMGLIISSVFLELMSIHMIYLSRSRVGVVAGSYLSIAGMFLALIAVYPAGTRPHVFISTWFFIQAFLAVLLYGISRLRDDMIFSASILILFTLALLGPILRWPSAASLETYEIILLTIFAAIYVFRS